MQGARVPPPLPLPDSVRIFWGSVNEAHLAGCRWVAEMGRWLRPGAEVISRVAWRECNVGYCVGAMSAQVCGDVV